MVKNLSDTCLDFICNSIGYLNDLHSCLTLEQKTTIIGRLAIHQQLTADALPVIKDQLFSPALYEINLQQCKQIDDRFLSSLGSCCFELNSLTIVSCSNVTDNGLQDVLKNLKNLKRLTLTNLTQVDGSCFTTMSSNKLTYADLQQNYSLTDSGISDLVQHCQGINYLNLYCCSKLTNAGLECIAGYLLGKLESLNCSYVTGMSDVSLISLADRCFHLSYLKLHGCTKITPVGLRAVFKACPIVTIDLSYCYELKMEPDLLFDCLPLSLSRLTLRGTQVGVQFFDSLSVRCKNIHTLKLCGIRSLTDEVVCGMLKNIGCRLANLDLSWCFALTDVTVQAVVQFCPMLSKLAMTYCNGITGEPLKTLASVDREKQAKGLRKLALQACRQFNTAVLCELVPRLANLQYIGVSGQRDFTDEDMFCLAQSCPRLRNLNIKGCIQVTDSGVCELLRFCPFLESLVLAGLHLLTDRSIFFMASSISSTLKYLYISGCSRISSPAVTYLKDVCVNYLFVEHKVPNAAPDQLMARNLDTGEFCRADLIHFTLPSDY